MVSRAKLQHILAKRDIINSLEIDLHNVVSRTGFTGCKGTIYNRKTNRTVYIDTVQENDLEVFLYFVTSDLSRISKRRHITVMDANAVIDKTVELLTTYPEVLYQKETQKTKRWTLDEVLQDKGHRA